MYGADDWRGLCYGDSGSNVVKYGCDGSSGGRRGTVGLSCYHERIFIKWDLL